MSRRATRKRSLPSWRAVQGATGKRSLPVWSAALATLCVLLGGCKLMSSQGPVPKPVAEARQLSQRGMSAMERADWDGAESLLAQAVKVCPDDIEARRQYAEALWKQGQTTLALKQLEQALQLAPDDCGLATRAGEMRLAMGQTDAAARIAEQALDLNPAEPGAWVLRARVELARGQLDRALADFQRAMEFRRGDRELLLEIAELYRHLNRPQRALATLIALQETYGPGEEPQQVSYLEGLALAALERHSDAADRFAIALTRGPPSAELLCYLAQSQFQAGQPADAQRTIDQAIGLDPQHAPSLALRQQIEVVAGAAVKPYR